MQALVDKWAIKRYAEQYPNFHDCPPYVFVDVLPVLTEEAAQRLRAALKRRKPKAKSKSKSSKKARNRQYRVS